MWNIPTIEQLSQIPKLYETESVQLMEKTVYMHFFIFGCDWFICEYDGEDLMWGFTILNQDYECAEWGYISFSELRDLNIIGYQIDLDLYWQPKMAIEVDKICKGNNWDYQFKGVCHAKG